MCGGDTFGGEACGGEQAAKVGIGVDHGLDHAVHGGTGYLGSGWIVEEDGWASPFHPGEAREFGAVAVNVVGHIHLQIRRWQVASHWYFVADPSHISEPSV